MKNIIYTIIITLFAALFTNMASPQDHGSWVIPPYRIDFYETGSIVSSNLLDPEEPYYFSDAGIDNTGNLKFYIIDNRVYDANSQIIATLTSVGGWLQNKAQVINVPGQYDQYYIIWGSLEFANGSLRYAKVDCTGGNPIVVFDTQIMTTIEMASFAITDLQNGIRRMYVAEFGELFRYVIDGTGISFDQYIVTSTDPILNNPDFFLAHNIEVNSEETEIAWCTANPNQKVFIVQLSSQGGFLSSSIIKEQFVGLSLQTSRGAQFCMHLVTVQMEESNMLIMPPEL